MSVGRSMISSPAVAAGWSLYCRVATGMWVPTSYYVRADGVAFLGNLRYLDRIVGPGTAKALGRAAGIGLRVIEDGGC